MFTNMLAPHHHRPPSPVCTVTSLNTNNYSTEQKYTPLHNAADAMRRHCMTSPVAYSGNLFAGFDESFLARAEALAAVDYTGKNQFKPEPTNHSYYAPSATHYVTQQHTAPAMPPPVYSSMHPPSAFHHTAALQSTLETNDVIDQLGSSHGAFPTYQHPTFNTSSVMMSSADPVSQPHYISHTAPPYNPTSHFHPVSSSIHPSIPPPSSTTATTTQPASPNTIVANFPASEYDADPRELEAFAERFKQRRIKLGVTQNDVGRALANLKLPGVGSLSQSTICRFESLTLSHNNMVALKPILIAWLEKAEEEHRRKMESAGLGDKKRKRTSIAAPEKRSLEAYFAVQPRPSSEKIAAIAEKLDLKKNVVRVWFCNQRQKQKRMKFSAFNAEAML
uniref:POU domain protein n=1 Tax=Phallusia mammillata TaxID=59560 RepID=A0A6F9DPU4_9ASCI|nr:POU domain, class 4, transcription factor [Phallusia mammillata]